MDAPGTGNTSTAGFLPLGTVLQGRYRLEKILGFDWRSNWYAATDTQLERRVTLQEFFPRASVRREEGTESVQSFGGANSFLRGLPAFLKQAEKLARLGTGIPAVWVLDVFETNRTAYVVMEACQGRTLREEVEAKGPLPSGEAFALLHLLAAGLADCHAAGVFHWDIRPENLLRLSDGRVKLIRFDAGYKDRLQEEPPDAPGALAASPYAPPELAREFGDRPRCDVYGLCASICFCLTGREPPSGQVRLNALADGRRDPLLLGEVAGRRLGAELSRWEERMLLKGLELDPEKRWQTMNPLKEPARDSGRADLLPAGTRLGTSYQIECLQWESRTLRNYLAWDGGRMRRVTIWEYFPSQMARRDASRSLEVRTTSTQGEQAYQTGLECFLQWAKVFLKLQGVPQLVPVQDAFLAHHTAYVVEELPDGRSAAERAAQQEKIDAEQVFSALRTAARGAAAIHAGGTILEEIVPEQLLWREDGRVQLAGLFARKVEEELSKIVSADDVPPGPLSPYRPLEFDKRDLGEKGPWSDGYSLCAIAYTCLTGNAPPNALERERALRTGAADPLVLPSELGIKLTYRQQAVLRKGLALSPEERWRSMEELSGALEGPPDRAEWERNGKRHKKGGAGPEPKPKRGQNGWTRFWTWLWKPRDEKKRSIAHYLAPIPILAIVSGAVAWTHRLEPPTPQEEQWEKLQIIGTFSDGDLTYRTNAIDVPGVWVIGYTGSGTEVTIPEKVLDIPVVGIEPAALTDSGLETVYLPDSIPYDPAAFPSACTVIGGRPKEAGQTNLEQQLNEAARTDSGVP